MRRLVLVSVALAALPLSAGVLALAHDSPSGCTPRDHPTPVPTDATTVPVTNTQMWQRDGKIYAHSERASVMVDPSGNQGTWWNFSGPAEGFGFRLSPNASKKACIEVDGNTTEP